MQSLFYLWALLLVDYERITFFSVSATDSLATAASRGPVPTFQAGSHGEFELAGLGEQKQRDVCAL